MFVRACVHALVVYTHVSIVRDVPIADVHRKEGTDLGLERILMFGAMATFGQRLTVHVSCGLVKHEPINASCSVSVLINNARNKLMATGPQESKLT